MIPVSTPYGHGQLTQLVKHIYADGRENLMVLVILDDGRETLLQPDKIKKVKAQTMQEWRKR
jgi:hypothetical protein|tara:strand:+ start:2001 stop:2186 length:186 start_codon:yes stop_codon:yes gene_type:complete